MWWRYKIRQSQRLLISWGRWEARLTRQCGRWLVDWLTGLGWRVSRLAMRQPRRWRRPPVRRRRQTVWQINWRGATSFIFCLVILLLPLIAYRHYYWLAGLKNQITSTAQAAFDKINAARDDVAASNFSAAQGSFAQAGRDFLDVEKSLAEVNGLLLSVAQIAPSPALKLAGAGQNIAAAGRLASDLGVDLSQALSNLFDTKTTLTYRLEKFVYYGRQAVERAASLETTLARIDESQLPANVGGPIKTLKDKTQGITGNLTALVKAADDLKNFLGASEDKRYLLIFQNNSEARATGGFMGSLAEVDLSRGQIKRLEVPTGGTYDSQAGLRRQIVAPQPLWLVSPQWYLWDANWWPDWPTSAQKIMWFYEKSDGPSVDGVIAFTPQVLADLLKVTGPVTLADYGVALDADNFLDVVQYFAERKTPANQPKAIIGVLLDQVIAKLSASLDRDTLVKLLSAVDRDFQDKHILVYFNDPVLQNKITSYGWDGGVKNTDGDYLLVVDSNIAGGKSDRRVTETINQQAAVQADGSVLDTVVIKRQHNGSATDEFSGVRNVDWLRLYVPLGSELLSASGFKAPADKLFEQPAPGWENDPQLANENQATIDPMSGTHVYREGDKTVFANWSMVDRGQTAELTFVYKLPFNLAISTDQQNSGWRALFNGQNLGVYRRYTLLAQKQPGTTNRQFQNIVKLPTGWQTVWSYPDDSTAAVALDTDNFRAYLFQQK